VLCSGVHAGDPGRARAAPVHGLRGPRARPAPSGPARELARKEDPARGQPPRRGPPRSRRHARPAGPRAGPPGARPRRRALQEPFHAGDRLRRHARGPPGPRRPRRRSRRRRRGRPRGLRRRDLDEGCRLGGHPDHPALDGRQLDRRQGGRQPREGQEHDRGLPPAARGGDRPQVPGDAARSPAPLGRLRDPQVRDPRGPRALRVDPRGPGRPARLGPGGRGERDRHGLPDQGRGGGERRARGGPAARPEPRPHDRPRAGGRDGLPPLHARRGRGLGDDRRGLRRAPARPAPGGDLRRDRLGRGPRRAAAEGLRPRDALSRDKKAKAGRVPFVLPTAIGRVAIHDDVARDEVLRALRVMAGREALVS
jgi:hypothetical protein